jgi:hypothetical protein
MTQDADYKLKDRGKKNAKAQGEKHGRKEERKSAISDFPLRLCVRFSGL